jgi:hypothetical protein
MTKKERHTRPLLVGGKLEPIGVQQGELKEPLDSRAKAMLERVTRANMEGPKKHPRGFYFMPRMEGMSFQEAAEKLARQVELLEARANQRWVSVKDRLPDVPKRGFLPGVQVLVWPYAHGSAVAFYGRRYSRKAAFYLYGTLVEVTHWMPLPEGPK